MKIRNLGVVSSMRAAGLTGRLLALAFSIGLSAMPALAQDLGDAVRGQKLAAQYCSECHRTEAGPGASPLATAPRFSSVAKTKGMNAMALNVWLKTSHPTMPNIQLTPNSSDDIVAYILSLRSSSAPKSGALDKRI